MCDLRGLDVQDQIEHPRNWEVEVAIIQRESAKAERADLLSALLFPGLPMIAMVAGVIWAICH